MARTWLVLDSTYLCYRAYYAMGHLMHGDVRTGVLYGFMNDIINLQDLYATNRIVFCFDYGKPHRKKILPTYKSKRHEVRHLEGDKLEQYTSLQEQIKMLRTDYLKRLGFRNVLYAKGFEADDIVASVVKNLPGETDRAVIVTADSDFYQLLGPNVTLYNPYKKEVTTEKSFTEKWNLRPEDWVKVKAIAGCRSDEIPGVVGVAEKTAARFVNGTIVPKSEAFRKITMASSLWSSNYALVRLPFEGTPVFRLRKDKASAMSWRLLADKLGMSSIRNMRR